MVDNLKESVMAHCSIPFQKGFPLTPGLPIIPDISHFADLLHVSVSFLMGVHSIIEKEYYTKKIPKKGNGFRIIEAPSVKLKGIQAWILRNILDKVVSSPYSTAYKKGCSIVNNVNPHQNGLFFLSFDLKDFFPSIYERRIVGIFNALGYSRTISQFLAHICTFRGHLPQGAVTSPALSNLVAYHLDYRLGGYAGKKKFVYTRYADDITFSSGNRNVLSSSRRYIKRIIKNEGFVVNTAKTHFSGPGTKSCITGLVKNNSCPSFSVGRKKKNHMKSVIFNLIINNRVIDDKYPSIESVECWVKYASMVEGNDDCDYLRRYISRLSSNQKRMGPQPSDCSPVSVEVYSDHFCW